MRPRKYIAIPILKLECDHAWLGGPWAEVLKGKREAGTENLLLILLKNSASVAVGAGGAERYAARRGGLMMLKVIPQMGTIICVRERPGDLKGEIIARFK